MTPQETFIARLRRHRERNHISLEELVNQTRIKREQLSAFANPECSRSCVARASASARMSAFVPNRRQPVGHALMQAGSSPCPTRSEQRVHLYTFLVSLLNFGMSNGQPDTQ